jgi:ATP-binding cassette, subfamily C, bacterial LapB
MTGPSPPAALQEKLEAAFSAQSLDASGSASPVADQLVLAIAEIARRHGLARPVEGIVAGLPLVRGRLPMAHAGMAAERAGLAAEVFARPVGKIEAHDCPLVLPMKNGSVLIAAGVEGRGKDRCIVVEIPGGEHPPRAVPVKGLARVATGEALRLKPLPEAIETLPMPEVTTARRWFSSAFRNSGPSYANVVLATIALNVLAVALPLFTMNVYDRVIPNAALDTLAALSIGALLAIAFDFVMRTLRADLLDVTGRAADIRLSNSLFARLLGARLNTSPAAVGVQANTLREFETLRDFFQSLTLTTLGDLPFAIAFFAAIWLIAGPLVIVPAIAAPLTLIVCIIIQRRLSAMLRDQFRDMAQRNAVAVETITGLETLKSLGAESWAAERWERATADGIRVSTEIRRLTNLASHVVMATQSLVTVLMVLHGAHLVLGGQISTGALIAGVMLAGRALAPVGQIALLMTKAFQARQAYDALKPVLEAPQERETGRAFVAAERINGGLALDNVSFAYVEDGEPVLRNLSLTVRPGERIAVLGAIGSGKSTMLRLFPALLLPREGQALVDGIAVRHIDPAVLRRAVAHVPQDAVLFRGTLRQNILIHAPRAGERDLIEAVGVSGLGDWVSRLPKGLDTVVGERGQGLSGGQKQAVALARALVMRHGRPHGNDAAEAPCGLCRKQPLHACRRHPSTRRARHRRPHPRHRQRAQGAGRTEG